MKKYFKRLSLGAGLSLALVAAGCGNTEDAGSSSTPAGDAEPVEVSVAEQLDYTITGIEAGAGLMAATQQAIEEYGLDEYNLQVSSSPAMTSALANAIANEEPIVVTGWTPHWKFAAYDLKYLEDPKGVFGGSENIHTLVREGLEEDKPEAFEVLNNFYWTPDDMHAVMVEVNEGKDPREAATEWLEANEDLLAQWTEGVGTVDGEKIQLTFVAWDSEIASTNVIGLVLESIGYDVTLTSLEPGPMFVSISTGSADAMVAAWLPATHDAYYEDHKDKLVDLGPNLEGAKIGLVVPAYMDIESVEDLLN